MSDTSCPSTRRHSVTLAPSRGVTITPSPPSPIKGEGVSRSGPHYNDTSGAFTAGWFAAVDGRDGGSANRSPSAERYFSAGARAGKKWLANNPPPDGPRTVDYTLRTASGRETKYTLTNAAAAIRRVRDRLAKGPADWVFLQRGESGADGPMDGEVPVAKGLVGVPAAAFTEHEAEIVRRVHGLAAKLMPGVRVREYARLRATKESGQAGPVRGAHWRTRDGEGIAFVVAWALDAKNPDQTIRHEAIHYLNRSSLLDNEEWATLARAAELGDWIAAHNIVERYGSDAHERHIEEAIAEQFSKRAIADYVVGISGYLARRRFAGVWQHAIEAIPRTMPRLKEYAQKYQAYVQNPAEEFQMLRQAGFIYYLAGSPATAMVNLSQVPIITGPYLAMFHGKAGVARELARANKDVMAMLTRKNGMDMFDPKKAPADMAGPLQEAWDQGHFVPLNTWEVMGTAHNRSARMRGLSKKARTAVDVVAWMFTMAERMNRLVTFIAAYRIARAPGAQKKIGSVLAKNALARSDELLRGFTPEKFAGFVIDETHYRMGKVNRPTVMRGPGAALFQFKGFVMQTMELFYRLATQNGRDGKVALATMLAIVFSVSGFWGLPFAEDIGDLLEALVKKFSGLDLDTRTELREIIADLTGSSKIAEIFSRGAGRAVGVDLTRIGMGKVVPHDMEEAAGIPFALTLGRIGQAIEYGKHGQPGMALGEALPTFIKNPVHAVAWGAGGIQSQATGKTVITKDDISAPSLALKFIGFTPSAVSNARESEFAQTRSDRASAEVRSQYYLKLARALAQQEKAERAGDAAGAKSAAAEFDATIAEIAKFNAGRPEFEQVIINKKSLRDRVAEEMMGAEVRDKKAPKQARSRREEIERIYGQ